MSPDPRRSCPAPPDLEPTRLTQPLAQPAAAGATSRLAGLEVQDSSFDAWLAAGGERRSKPRPPNPPKST
ncbi:MAG: hypothetical protein ACOVN9_04420 [Inhella sp.]